MPLCVLLLQALQKHGDKLRPNEISNDSEVSAGKTKKNSENVWVAVTHVTRLSLGSI